MEKPLSSEPQENEGAEEPLLLEPELEPELELPLYEPLLWELLPEEEEELPLLEAVPVMHFSCKTSS
jgi:hypothetical protein